MPNRLPSVTGRDVVRALERGGWELQRVAGGHHHYRHPSRGGLVTVPVHAGQTLPVWLVKSILRQAGLTDDEFRDLL
jgi:predicted RNA binding protein YcfA (HicA-like mRNA interferase family)